MTSTNGLPVLQNTETSSNDKTTPIPVSHVHTEEDMSHFVSAVTSPINTLRNLIKDALNYHNFQEKVKLAGAEWLILAQRLRADQVALDYMVQTAAPFVKKWTVEDRVLYVEKAKLVELILAESFVQLYEEAHKKSQYSPPIYTRKLTPADNRIRDAVFRYHMHGAQFRKSKDPKKIVDLLDDYEERSDRILKLLSQEARHSDVNTMIGYSLSATFVRSKYALLKDRAQAASDALTKLDDWLKGKKGYANAIAFDFGMVPQTLSHKVSAECGSMLAALHRDIEQVTSRSPSDEHPEWYVRLVRTSTQPSEILSSLSSNPHRKAPMPPTNMMVRGMRPHSPDEQTAQTTSLDWSLLFVESIQPPKDESKKNADTTKDADATEEADAKIDSDAKKSADAKKNPAEKAVAELDRVRNVPSIETFKESTRAPSWPKLPGRLQEAYPVGKFKAQHGDWVHVLYLVSGLELKRSKACVADKITTLQWRGRKRLQLRFEMASALALFFVAGHDLMFKLKAWPSLKDLVYIVDTDLDDVAQQWTDRQLELDICWEHGFGHPVQLIVSDWSKKSVRANHRIASEIGLLHAIMTGTTTGIAADVTPAAIEAMKLELQKTLDSDDANGDSQTMLGYDASIRKMFSRCLTWAGSPLDDIDGRQMELEAKQHIFEGLRFAWDNWHNG